MNLVVSSIVGFKTVISDAPKVRSLILLPDDVVCINRFVFVKVMLVCL